MAALSRTRTPPEASLAVRSARARARPTTSLRAIDVLFLCTGNICRSPMAEGLLRSRLAAAGIEAHVHSAGLMDDGWEASEHGVDVMSVRGIDSSQHRSRRMTADMLRGADLVLAMAREHVREAVLLAPEAWPRTFTLKEFVRRATDAGPRLPSESFEAWLNRLHSGRRTADLIGAAIEDDVEDPIGQPRPAYEKTADELDALVGRLAKLAWSA